MSVPVKRPTSVRVATFIVGFCFLGAIVITLRFLRVQPEERSLFFAQFKDPIYAGRITLCLVCFPALLVAPRAFFTYYSTAAFLALLTLATAQTALRPSGIMLSSGPASPLVAWLFAFLIGCLFSYFALGRASREYFGFRVSPPPLEKPGE